MIRLLDYPFAMKWNALYTEFIFKFHPAQHVHGDMNYIYKFLSRFGESTNQTWRRLISLILKCPTRWLSKEMIVKNFYARVSRYDKETLDMSFGGCFSEKNTGDKC